MLNKLMMYSSKRGLQFDYQITIGETTEKNNNTNEYKKYGYKISDKYDKTSYGNLSPNTFLNSVVTQLSSSVGCVYPDSGLKFDSIILELSDDRDLEGNGSSLKIERLDSGKFVNLSYLETKSYGQWSASMYDGETFFEAKDVGKTIPILIEYTPPRKLLRLLIQSIQNRLRSFRELCTGFCVLGIKEVVC